MSIWMRPNGSSLPPRGTALGRIAHGGHTPPSLGQGVQAPAASGLEFQLGEGDAPFYQLPFIDMRGIPVARYQDEHVAVLETEVRWNVTSRWALIGFLGAGRAWGREAFDGVGTQVAWGAGFRYLIARRLGLYVGMDYGRGPDDDAIYLQTGSAWR
jgi:hypothetical protein